MKKFEYQIVQNVETYLLSFFLYYSRLVVVILFKHLFAYECVCVWCVGFN